jgi:hypothetical protein
VYIIQTKGFKVLGQEEKVWNYWSHCMD